METSLVPVSPPTVPALPPPAPINRHQVENEQLHRLPPAAVFFLLFIKYARWGLVPLAPVILKYLAPG